MLQPKSRAMKKVTYILSDEITHHLFFARVLGSDYECYEISSKEFDVAEFKNFIMDLIIVNDTLYKNSLYSLLRTLRNSPDLAATPIIVITRGLKKNIHKKLKRSGASAILFEPLEESEVYTAMQESLAFHQVVEKTSHLKAPKMAHLQQELLQEQAVINVKMIERIQELFHQDQQICVTMGQVIALKKEVLSEEESLEAQEVIAKQFNQKSLFFLSSTEFFFASENDLDKIKLHCKTIKDTLYSNSMGVCYGIATKPAGKENCNVEDYLAKADKNLKQALKHPNTIIAN
jgi:response regulator RpfG family c-di-GMP phosphodiesterase